MNNWWKDDEPEPSTRTDLQKLTNQFEQTDLTQKNVKPDLTFIRLEERMNKILEQNKMIIDLNIATQEKITYFISLNEDILIKRCHVCKCIDQRVNQDKAKQEMELKKVLQED